jgi:hypothetical protein
VVGVERNADGANSPTQNYLRATIKKVPAMLGGLTATYNIRAADIENGIGEGAGDTLSFNALFDTEETKDTLVGRIGGLVSEYAIPPAVWTGEVDISLYASLDPCRWVSLTWNNPAAPINPFTGSRGWTSVIGRVLSASLPLTEDALTCKVSIELLGVDATSDTIARIAPACIVTGKGADGNGAYFTVSQGVVVVDDDTDKDMYHFAVGDKIRWYDLTGVDKLGAVRTITGFGTNFVSDPRSANSLRIYVDDALGPATASFDYITFSPWSAGNTARMDLYSAYADAAETLDVADPAKVYS